jgi:hypothetical protein
MKHNSTFPIIMLASTACIITGIISKQPLLQRGGEIAALEAISRIITVKQKQLDENDQKQLTLLSQENTCLQAKLSIAQYELNKLEDKVKSQDICQHLDISKVDKLHYEQKIIIRNIIQLQEMLGNKNASNSQKHQQTLQTASVKCLSDS